MCKAVKGGDIVLDRVQVAAQLFQEVERIRIILQLAHLCQYHEAHMRGFSLTPSNVS